MKEADVVKSLAALAQEVRLRVFRALVVAGAAGLTPEAFRKTVHLIKRRLKLLTHLPSDKLETALLQTNARELAKE